ncbi:hypothetical protein NDK50_13880 [Paraburkholderia bryophila]|uniref:hypothetical protein n=1 Tax=Paraburkholderia bryophila TaxID=420952 RepID=UPI0023490857|nr:hypothetical protein [Paraburkholderia bryophila]WCM18536.1 hypothetical protein NDK50_13880 [Paraburkholderia bryophila]
MAEFGADVAAGVVGDCVKALGARIAGIVVEEVEVGVAELAEAGSTAGAFNAAGIAEVANVAKVTDAATAANMAEVAESEPDGGAYK